MPEFELNELADVIGGAPQVSAVTMEAGNSPVLDGNFADRDAVMPVNEAALGADYTVAPPTMGA